MGKTWAIAAVLLLLPNVARSGEFEIFDGRAYNGKYYPRIDIIEWGEPSHMEFHVYSKKNPIDMSFQLETNGNRKVMLVNYLITDRKEHLCRRVLAPGHFLEIFYVYKDTSDPDFDNTIVSMEKLPDKKGQVLVSNPTKYAECTLDEPDQRMPASDNSAAAGSSDGAKPKDAAKAAGDGKAKSGGGFTDW